MKMRRLIPAAMALMMLLFAASCSAGAPKEEKAFEKVANKYGYSVPEGEQAGEEVSYGALDGLGDDKAVKEEKKKLKETLSRIKTQKMYMNEELDEKTGFVNILYFIETESEDDADTLFEYYESQYSQMEEAKKVKRGESVEYINYEDVYYLRACGRFLIKGQCNKKVIEEHENLLEEAAAALEEK